jgi:hypothetical protein
MTVTNPRAAPIFRTSTAVQQSAVVVALVSVTVTGTGAISFSAARCPRCRTLVMTVPGPERSIEARAIDRDTPFGSCRGRVVRCPTRRCQQLVEVIEHG